MDDNIAEELQSIINNDDRLSGLFDEAVYCTGDVYDYIGQIFDLLPSEYDDMDKIFDVLYEMIMDVRDCMPVPDISEGEEW
jgi:hypothetical protein